MGREELTLSVTGGHLWERVHQAIVDSDSETEVRALMLENADAALDGSFSGHFP